MGSLKDFFVLLAIPLKPLLYAYLQLYTVPIVLVPEVAVGAAMWLWVHIPINKNFLDKV